MTKQQLLRNIICQSVQEYQVAFLRRLADNLEKGVLLELSGDWSEFVGTIDDDICNVLNTEYSSNS